MIPVTNTPDLQLGPDLIDAVRAGRFHVWEAATIEQGIELLTGVPAGEWVEGSGWTEGSVYGVCEARLEEMVDLMRLASKGPGSRAATHPPANGEDDRDGDEGATPR